MPLKNTSEKVKAHTQYVNNNGDKIVGVTTVLSVLSKPFLIVWANKLGLQGIDSTRYVDKMANIGTIAHLLVMHHLKGTTPDLSEYSQSDIATAQNCMKSFYEWEKVHKIEPILLEVPLASDIYNYGGTADFIGEVDGTLELIDFKTGSGIYNDYLIQVSAYRQLAKERGHDINRARILRIGRDDNEGFEERLITRFDNEFELFKHCLAIYNLKKIMKWS
jgi:hypothetical protein